MSKLIVVIALIMTAAGLAGTADAGTRNFFNPTVGGDRLSFCANYDNICGKAIADAWCRAIGFEEAVTFRRDSRLDNKPIVARYADTGDVCRGKECQSFRQIKCWSGAS